ncbi:MAG: DNA topoisomerase IB [Gemmatimonadaceae bacterium]
MTTSSRASSVATLELTVDPVASARVAQLRYVRANGSGIRRYRSGSGFRYADAEGLPVVDDATTGRIRALAIPPAWTDVWICAHGNGHLQATGRDARGRKQYRYHARWRSVRDATKYDRMAQLGLALPNIRARVEEHLALSGLPRDKVLAAVVRLLETTMIRIGNEEYARANGSFGLTTLRNRHVVVSGAQIKFRFRGKSGKVHTISLSNRRLARIVSHCRELPGQELFQYLDDDDEPQRIDSGDVNAYLGALGGENITAKDLRTWAGTVLAAHHLMSAMPDESESERKSRVVAVIADVAGQLGNTPAICRKSYVHPAVIEAFLKPEVHEVWRRERARGGADQGLSEEETALLRYLRAVGTG